MKRYIVILAALLLVVHLFWGCESTFESASGPQTENLNKQLPIEIPDPLDPEIVASLGGGETPLFVTTLPNGKIVSIFAADTSGDCITVAFTYTSDIGAAIDRILQIDESLESMYLYDNAGLPLSGYSLDRNATGAVDFSVFSGANAFGISQFTSSTEPIDIEVLYNDQFTQVAFADRSEFRAAAQIYQDVQSGVIDPDDLSPSDQELLEKAEKVATWSELNPIEQEDIETSALLVLDYDFQNWSDADYSADQPFMEVPEWLKIVCGIISYAEEICDWFSIPIVCTAVKILSKICNVLLDFLS